MLDLNHILVISIGVLAFFSFCFFVVLVPIVFQLLKTLNSLQHLLDTVNSFDTDVREVKENISKIKNALRWSTDVFGSGFRNIGILFKSSAYGFIAGLKKYFSDYKTPENSYNDKRGYEVDIKYVRR